MGRKHVAPAFVPAHGTHLAEITNNRTGPGGRALHGGGGNSRFGDAYADEAPVGVGQLVGYRATAFKPGAPSMLGGLGAAVSQRIHLPERSTQRETISDVRAREKGTHLFDVVPDTTPGYTGRQAR